MSGRNKSDKVKRKQGLSLVALDFNSPLNIFYVKATTQEQEDQFIYSTN